MAPQSTPDCVAAVTALSQFSHCSQSCTTRSRFLVRKMSRHPSHAANGKEALAGVGMCASSRFYSSGLRSGISCSSYSEGPLGPPPASTHSSVWSTAVFPSESSSASLPDGPFPLKPTVVLASLGPGAYLQLCSPK